MKTFRLIFLFFLVFLSNQVAAQTQDEGVQQDTFILERWSRAIGQRTERVGLWGHSGLVVRVGSGVRMSFDKNFGVSRVAATTPLDVEIGAKFHWIEAGLQISPGGLPWGSDSGTGQLFFSNEVWNNWSDFSMARKLGYYGKIHARIIDFPVFVGFGQQKISIPKYARRVIRNDTSGRSVVYANRSAFGGALGALQELRSRQLSIGVSNGPFWMAYTFERWDTQLDPASSMNFYILSVRSITAGIQWAPGSGALGNLRTRRKGRDTRWLLSTGYNGYVIPLGPSALSSGWFMEGGVRIRPHWRLGARYSGGIRLVHGQDRNIIRFKDAKELLVSLPGRYYAITDKHFTDRTGVRAQVFTDYVPAHEKPFQWAYRFGLSYYDLQQPLKVAVFEDSFFPFPALEEQRPIKTLGPMVGGGFDYRATMVRGVFHVPLGDFPPFFELSAGIRVSR
jgi:hypothetical protein